MSAKGNGARVSNFKYCCPPRNCLDKYILSFKEGTKNFELLLDDGVVRGSLGGMVMLGNRTGSFVVGKVVHLPASTPLDVLFKHYAFENILPFCKTVEEATTTICPCTKKKDQHDHSS